MPQVILYIQKNEDKIYKSDKIACYLAADSLSEERLKEAVATGKMVLTIGSTALDVCQKFGLDGVVKEIDDKKPIKVQLKPLREALKKKTLGVIVPARRHEAMLAGEVEPEFLAFKDDETIYEKEMISWYNELFLIPSAVLIEKPQRDIKGLDVDFVIIPSNFFENFGC